MDVAITNGWTATQTAAAIAAVTTYTGWVGEATPTSTGATVTFIQGNPAAPTGAFTLTSTGNVTGSFTALQTGIANTYVASADGGGVYASSDWNIDPLNGSGPSGIAIDWTVINTWRIRSAFAANAPIYLDFMNPYGGQWLTVHVDRLPNTSATPALLNPSWRVGLTAASLGSTTALEVRAWDCSAQTEEPVVPLRPARAITNSSFTATGTESVCILIRVRGEYQSTVNLMQVLLHTIRVGIETANRVTEVRVVRNPTVTGTADWAYFDQSTSVIEYVTPTAGTLTISGGTLVDAAPAPTGAPLDLEVHERSVRLARGDTLAIAIKTVSSTATLVASVSWDEI